MELNRHNVETQLATVIDPETGLDLFSMGLFYQIKIDKHKLYIEMTLTSPGCPLVDVFDQMIRDALDVFDDFDSHRDLMIDLTFDPPWTPDMMSDEAKAELGLD